MCKFFASELGFKLGIMRGFQKGITLGGRTPVSACKVPGGVRIGLSGQGSGYLVYSWILKSISLLS